MKACKGVESVYLERPEHSGNARLTKTIIQVIRWTRHQSYVPIPEPVLYLTSSPCEFCILESGLRFFSIRSSASASNKSSAQVFYSGCINNHIGSKSYIIDLPLYQSSSVSVGASPLHENRLGSKVCISLSFQPQDDHMKLVSCLCLSILASSRVSMNPVEMSGPSSTPAM